jgi:flagellar protein FliO/FliZ
MAFGSLFTVVALFAAVLAVAGAGFYFYSKSRGDGFTAWFAPRVRRLAFIERTHLDGGRKLLLVRRDNVEHLILIGGPIDLIVETGIEPRAEAVAAREDYLHSPPNLWEGQKAPLSGIEAKAAAEPRLSKASSSNSEMLELTSYEEAKTPR